MTRIPFLRLLCGASCVVAVQTTTPADALPNCKPPSYSCVRNKRTVCCVRKAAPAGPECTPARYGKGNCPYPYLGGKLPRR